MKLIIPCLTSFLLTAAITPLVIRLATICNCLDIPGGRRIHSKTTPRWGGLAFFSGVLPFLLTENGDGSLTYYIVASVLLIAMGMIDDFRSLGWIVKFAVMAAAASIVIFSGQCAIHHIGIIGPLGGADLGWFSIPFTFISILGITNAINLLDGLNGLAGGVSLLGFLFMGIAALISGNIVVAVICFAFVGALAAFLLYNFPHARIFMGDTGSLFLGFSLAVTAILLTQNASSSVNVLFPVLVLLIPIFDTLRVLFVRVQNGKNPFKADSLHLHYLMVQQNISPAKVTLLFWSMTSIFGGIALSLAHRATVPFLIIIMCAVMLLARLASSLMQKGQAREADIFETALPRGVSGDQFVETNTAAASYGVAEKGVIMAIYKWMIGMGFVLLGTQVFADSMPAPATGQVTQDAQPTPYSKGTLSRHNQAKIKQSKAEKKRSDISRPALSKRNQAVIDQTEAAKARRELINKSNPDSAKQ